MLTVIGTYFNRPPILTRGTKALITAAAFLELALYVLIINKFTPAFSSGDRRVSSIIITSLPCFFTAQAIYYIFKNNNVAVEEPKKITKWIKLPGRTFGFQLVGYKTGAPYYYNPATRQIVTLEELVEDDHSIEIRGELIGEHEGHIITIEEESEASKLPLGTFYRLKRDRHLEKDPHSADARAAQTFRDMPA